MGDVPHQHIYPKIWFLETPNSIKLYIYIGGKQDSSDDCNICR